ncbi:MAG: carboxymuconolactone decarboxylase family protein [Pseudobdellovibrio sp.]
MTAIDSFLNQEFSQKQTSLFNDLKLNFQKLTEGTSLDDKETFVSLVATARALHWNALEDFGISQLKELKFSEKEIEEVLDVAALMSMNNVYYKFKGALTPELAADPAYGRIGLRNTSLKQTLIGQHLTEVAAFSVSVVNGCAICIVNHEKALTNLSVTREKIHNVARLASVVKGLSCTKR